MMASGLEFATRLTAGPGLRHGNYGFRRRLGNGVPDGPRLSGRALSGGPARPDGKVVKFDPRYASESRNCALPANPGSPGARKARLCRRARDRRNGGRIFALRPGSKPARSMDDAVDFRRSGPVRRSPSRDFLSRGHAGGFRKARDTTFCAEEVLADVGVSESRTGAFAFGRGALSPRRA